MRANVGDLQMQKYQKQLIVLDKQIKAATATCNNVMRKMDSTLFKLNELLEKSDECNLKILRKCTKFCDCHGFQMKMNTSMHLMKLPVFNEIALATL